LDYANQYNLLASAGSDFHRIGRHIELGRDIKLPEHAKPIWHDWNII
jgi:hypothetical protein